MPRTVAVASTEIVQETAQRALSDGKTALAAALSGFFVDAGESPGVLFSPVSLLVGGIGSGAFAYDGRHRQPGRDAKRPKGLEDGQTPPDIARVAIPRSVWAIAMACAFHPSVSMLSVARPGVQAAKRAKSPGRAELIERIATRGAAAFSDAALRKSWLTQFGAVEGGLVTASDLGGGQSAQTKARELEEGFVAPWYDEEVHRRSGQPRYVLAGDAQGLFVALAYSKLQEPGLVLDPYEVLVPLTAEPVLRGVPRVAPGAALPHGNTLLLSRAPAGGPIGAEVRMGSERLRIARADGTREISLISQDVG